MLPDSISWYSLLNIWNLSGVFVLSIIQFFINFYSTIFFDTITQIIEKMTLKST